MTKDFQLDYGVWRALRNALIFPLPIAIKTNINVEVLHLCIHNTLDESNDEGNFCDIRNVATNHYFAGVVWRAANEEKGKA